MAGNVYDRVWTIRGMVDVSQDIYMIPGDRIRFVGNSDGTMRVVVINGNSIWEGCVDLHPIAGAEAQLNTPLPYSLSMCDRGDYHMEIRNFINAGPNKHRRLEGTLPAPSGLAKVTVIVARTRHRNVMIINAVPKDGASSQNGTGHGD